MTLPLPYSQKNIYLADDDDDDREMFAEALSEIDNTVILTQAQDGQQLMDILYKEPNPLPDIIFMDINMPKQDGLKCLEEIRNQCGNLKELFVIILSTSSDPLIIDKAFDLGATFYAVKPSSFVDLKSFIKEVLQIDWFSIEKSNLKFRLI
ncbi:response regulator [Flavobacterium sp. ov086]|uniref:response regulator n=1 Tax=Flavobacterium sp. ov086 TaxID=1761785 RepID=UPI000B7516F3|nr:response regulator [Flavobacterium sp. ov086]SNR95572.1 Response regulator receiver domain-containing protein [Flavobacterium sp. ov086]